jgi:hypothetical protein
MIGAQFTDNCVPSERARDAGLRNNLGEAGGHFKRFFWPVEIFGRRRY